MLDRPSVALLASALSACAPSQPAPAEAPPVVDIEPSRTTPQLQALPDPDPQPIPRQDVARSENAEIGAPPPELQARYVTGDGPRTLHEALGLIVILDFWATYSSPSRHAFPAYEKLRSEDVVVIAISVDHPDDTSDKEIIAFVKELGANFTVLRDEQHKTAELYKPPRMPSTYVIDRKGALRHIHGGFQGNSVATIREEIAALSE